MSHAFYQPEINESAQIYYADSEENWNAITNNDTNIINTQNTTIHFNTRLVHKVADQTGVEISFKDGILVSNGISFINVKGSQLETIKEKYGVANIGGKEIVLGDNEGNILEIDEVFTIKMPVPDGCETSRLKLYYVNSNNAIVEKTAKYADGYMVFKTDYTGYGVYYITDENLLFYGDATGDKVINGIDIVRLTKYIANYDYDTGTSTTEIYFGADANGDGEINGLDIVRLTKYIANYDYDTETSTIALGPYTSAGEQLSYDPITEMVGNYVTLEYNPMYCTVTTSFSKGFGAKEIVTLKVTMLDGYIFDGWSTVDYICNANQNSIIKNTETYVFEVNVETKVFVNYSMRVVYEANGGTTSDGKTNLDTTFCLSEFKCPSTLPDKGQFIRDGYVLSEYNTKADGTGTAVSLGSKIRSDSSTLTLYCIWLKTNDASDFTYTKSSNITITGYSGSSKDVVIPETIEGKSVTTIAAYAFNGLNIESVFIPKTIQKVENNAFNNCSNLTSITIFDSIESINDASFSGCEKFTSIRINAVTDMYYVGWITGTYCKTDRLVWAADMKKFVVCGGMNTLYGIDSAKIDEEIGSDYVVINMGANASVSSAFFFEGMQKWLNEGDIVIWSPEPSSFTLGQTNIMSRAIEFYVCGNYDFLKGIDCSKYDNFFSSLINVFNSKKSGRTTTWEYGSINYNCYGDMVTNRNHQERDYYYNFNYFGYYDYSRMNEIIVGMKNSGVKVWFTYAAMAESGSGLEESILEEYTNNIINTFDVEIISDIHDCLIPNVFFWDSEWHLTNEGAAYRTQKLLVDIMTKIEKKH